MIPAIFSRTYRLTTARDTFAAAHADGFAAVQFNLSNLGAAPLPDTLPDTLDLCRAEAAAAHIQIAALSGTWNMAHPDPTHRAAQRPRFLNVLHAAKRLGTPIVTLCTGSRDPTDMWAAHPDNATPEAWRDLCTELTWALDQAAHLGLRLAIEPEPANVIADAQTARRILDEMQAPHLGIVLDAANLIPAKAAPRQKAIVDHALLLLGDSLLLAHAKDHDSTGKVVTPGDGVIDLPAFATALKAAGFTGPLIAHGFDAPDAPRAAAVLRALCRP